MEESFSQWQDSPGVTKKTRSFVISDSDEDSENTEKEQIFVIESSEASVNSSAEE